MSDNHTITKQEAIAALRAGAFTVDDPESSDHGRTIVHCRMSFTGADWDLGDAIAEVERADQVGWVGSIFDHDLAVLSGGKVYRFGIKQPEADR